MREKSPPPQNPADVARETFSRLARERIAPTPDNYRDIYNEIVGIVSESNAESVLAGFAQHLAAMPGEATTVGEQLRTALKARDWTDYSAGLVALANRHLLPKPVIAAPAPAPVPTVAPRPIEAPAADVDIQVKQLREMLSRTLGYALPPLLINAPELISEAEAISVMAKDARSEIALTDLAARLKKFCFKLDTKGVDLAEQQEMLLQLFRLLLENVAELLEDDSWLRGQIGAVHKLLAGPITHLALKDATASLKEVIYQQGLLKHSLTEAKVTVKSMMLTFVERLGAVADSTGDYHQKIDQYSKKISLAQDVKDLNEILDGVMRETRAAQEEALRSRDQMESARQEMTAAEDRIHKLESQLEHLSELVREDELTGSLNRRGLDEVFEREFARVDRKGSHLCVAMLDLDDFKRLNDTHGHLAGDGALVHLVTIVKDTLRTMDVVGRFGGEEFLVILPDTTLALATQTITRLQRELTKRIFMFNDAQLLITFSAGVAARQPNEDVPSLIGRADGALYEAKKAGKNRVVAAQ
jgi:diguanylate cyclase